MRRLCGITRISPKHYYSCLKGPSRKAMSDKALGDIARRLQEEHGNALGYRPMAVLVSAETGEAVNSKRMLRIMRDEGILSSVRRRRYTEEVYAERRRLEALRIPDLIRRDFSAMEPGKRFVGDITYLPSLEGTMYLNSIVDLYKSEIVAWGISDHPDTALCVGTVMKLSERYGGRLEGSVLHSDAGATYTSFSYRECLESLGVTQSMGAKATCYDNAAMESVNGIIKTEALYAKLGKTKVKERRVPREEILSQVTSFIRYYNEARPKKRLGGLSPVSFRERNPEGTWLMVVNQGSQT